MTEAKKILERARKDRGNVVWPEFGRSPATAVSNWKENIREQLELFKRRIYIDIDFEGTIDSQIIDNAKTLICDLPLSIIEPQLGINADGTLLFEWARKEDNGNMTMFSVILNGTEMVSSLMESGDIKHYGVDLYSEISVTTAKNILTEYFEKPINRKTTAAG